MPDNEEVFTITVVKTFTEYLEALTAQVAKHGADAITDADERARLMFGFVTPEGHWGIRLGTVKGHYDTGEWREDTDLVECYKAAGGTAPITAITRLPPRELLIAFYKRDLLRALLKGRDLHEEAQKS